ncbi:hypothetical protein EV182_005192 [Spiromyces aspiralis]|uniref:Uncharacterized protein n=1 Tax=Spiromyces aspiralis TaxID=68401 RepID=A0ACC1HCU3_9FUNG|nr:hypothetical protein EV182_005192 [Spiromyces aspiralis]
MSLVSGALRTIMGLRNVSGYLRPQLAWGLPTQRHIYNAANPVQNHSGTSKELLHHQVQARRYAYYATRHFTTLRTRKQDRLYSTSPYADNNYNSSISSDGSAQQQQQQQQQGRLLIGFTCKVCNHRQYKTMSRLAYTKGVVLMQCDKCRNRHLIADHLGWFKDQGTTIEDIIKENGEEVRKIQDSGLLDSIEAEGVKKALEDHFEWRLKVGHETRQSNETADDQPPQSLHPKPSAATDPGKSLSTSARD